MTSLLRNRSFWMAVLALAQTLVLKYAGVDSDVWMSINAILLVVIANFTIEDAAEKVLLGLRETVVQLAKLRKE